jgi:hypothetical protein
VNYAQTETLVSNADHLHQEISSPGNCSYLDVLNSAHLVISPTKTMNVRLVTGALNVLVH